MISLVNTISNTLCGMLMRPFEVVSPWPGLIAASFIFALMALLVFKYCSNQAQLARSRNRLLARVLELQLFKDDLFAIFSITGRALSATLLYLKESIKPLLVLLIPTILFLIQLAGWFEYRPLQSGESFLLTLQLDKKHDPRITPLSISYSSGIQRETDAFVSPADYSVIWRLRMAKENASEWVRIDIGDQVFEKRIVGSSRLLKTAPKSVHHNNRRADIMNPTEPLPPTLTSIHSIEITYPQRELLLGSISIHWIVALFILSLFFGFILKYPFRVEF